MIDVEAVYIATLTFNLTIVDCLCDMLKLNVQLHGNVVCLFSMHTLYRSYQNSIMNVQLHDTVVAMSIYLAHILAKYLPHQNSIIV